MDPLAALQSELKKQKSALKSQKRWRSQAEIERERQDEYLQRQRRLEQERQANKRRKVQSHQSSPLRKTIDQEVNDKSNSTTSSRNNNETNKEKTTQSNKDQPPPLSKYDVIRKLRALKQPATCYGESDWDRFNRLRDVQISMEDQSDGQDNMYQKKLREVQAKDAKEDSYLFINNSSNTKNDNKEDSENKTKVITKITCKEDFVYLEIEKYMKLWRNELDEMDKEERRSNKGRQQLVIYEQTKEWLNPLNKLLLKRKLTKSILNALKQIFDTILEKEYILAMKLYLEKLAIGNAPWPMGATQVGIHSRAAREKIGEDKIAHVMNDEQTRKYIQAVKRLLTVAQKHFPTHPSKMNSST